MSSAVQWKLSPNEEVSDIKVENSTTALPSLIRPTGGANTKREGD